jgi:hypothetical protein
MRDFAKFVGSSYLASIMAAVWLALFFVGLAVYITIGAGIAELVRIITSSDFLHVATFGSYVVVTGRYGYRWWRRRRAASARANEVAMARAVEALRANNLT